MENTNRIGQVSRSLTLGLAAVATSFIFTSVAVVFTAGANGTVAAVQVAQASGVTPVALSHQG